MKDELSTECTVVRKRSHFGETQRGDMELFAWLPAEWENLK